MAQTNSNQNCVTLSDVTVSPLAQSNNSSNLTHILDKTNPFEAELADGKHKNILIIGNREMGKTHMVKHIANRLVATNTVKDIIVISNPGDVKQYNQMPNVINIYQVYETSYMEALVKSQSEPDAKPILIIFDDVLLPNKINNNDIFKSIILNGRHKKISTIVTVQFPISLSPVIRTNFDNVLIFYDCTISNVKKAYDHYGGFYPTFDLFNTIIRNLKPESYECLCIPGKNIKIPKCIYKAPSSNAQYFPASQVSQTIQSIQTTQSSQLNQDNLYDLQSNQQICSIINANSQIIAKLTNENNQICSIIKSNNEINWFLNLNLTKDTQNQI